MWYKLTFNKSQIAHSTDKATLIKLPQRSDLKGWGFWHPSKLVREDFKGSGEWFNFSFTDEWEFKLFRVNTKNDAKTVVGYEEMLEAFKLQQESSEDYDESYYIETEPEELKVDQLEVDESLKR